MHSRYETVADVAENEEQRRPNFQSGYRVLKLRRAKVDPYFGLLGSNTVFIYDDMTIDLK